MADHDHDHDHEGMLEDVELSYHAKRSLAIQELLDEKGLLTRTDLQRHVEIRQSRIPTDGAAGLSLTWQYWKSMLMTHAR